MQEFSLGGKVGGGVPAWIKSKALGEPGKEKTRSAV